MWIIDWQKLIGDTYFAMILNPHVENKKYSCTSAAIDVMRLVLGFIRRQVLMHLFY